MESKCIGCEWRPAIFGPRCYGCHRQYKRKLMRERAAARVKIPETSNPDRPATEKTEALPSDDEKVQAMKERAERGESLFHEDDGKRDLK